MFLLLLVVPGLMVVVAGYALGYAVWSRLAGMVDAASGTSLAAGAEVAGWVTGLLGLIGLLRFLVVRWRRGRWPWPPRG